MTPRKLSYLLLFLAYTQNIFTLLDRYHPQITNPHYQRSNPYRLLPSVKCWFFFKNNSILWKKNPRFKIENRRYYHGMVHFGIRSIFIVFPKCISIAVAAELCIFFISTNSQSFIIIENSNVITTYQRRDGIFSRKLYSGTERKGK